MGTVIGLVYVPETVSSLDAEYTFQHYCNKYIYQAEWLNVNEGNVKGKVLP